MPGKPPLLPTTAQTRQNTADNTFPELERRIN